MKKICFVTTVSVTLRLFFLKTAEYYHTRGGYDITFVCDEDPEFAKILPAYIHYCPVRMKRGISPGGFGAVLKMFSLFRKEKFDLIQYSTPNAAFYASIAAWLARVNIRLYAQCGIFYTGSTGLKRKIFKWIEKCTCKLSTHIQPVSKKNMEFGLAERLYIPQKAEVIGEGSSAGIDFTRFNLQNKTAWRQEIRTQYGLDSDFVFGYVGRINRDKGFNELLSAFEMLIKTHSGARLMIVGAQDNMQGVDADLYAWSTCCEKIIYTGAVSDVERYFSAMDCFVLPSYREGLATVAIESQAMGLPAIVTDIPGLIDAVQEDATAKVIPKQDAKAVYEAMQFFINHREQGVQMGETAHQFVLENFEQNMLIEKLYENKERLLV